MRTTPAAMSMLFPPPLLSPNFIMLSGHVWTLHMYGIIPRYSGRCLCGTQRGLIFAMDYLRPVRQY